jgi:hypothetical protein
MIAPNRTQLLLQLAAALLLVLGVQARTWNNADGSKTFEGELQSYDAASGKVSVTHRSTCPMAMNHLLRASVHTRSTASPLALA